MGITKDMIKKIDTLIDDFNNKSISEDAFIEKILDISTLTKYKPRTIVNKISNSKKYLIEKNIPRSIYSKIKPSKELIDRVIFDDQVKRASKINFIITKNIVQKIINNKDKGLMNKIVFVMLVSGRRINEILSDEFKISKYPKSKKKVRFSHLSKQKNKKSVVVELIPAALSEIDNVGFLKMVKKIRELIKGEQIAEVNRRFNKWLRRIIYWDMTSHSIRGIYGYMMWILVNKQQKNINGFLSDVLNHDSYDTSLSYSKYVIEPGFLEDLKNLIT